MKNVDKRELRINGIKVPFQSVGITLLTRNFVTTFTLDRLMIPLVLEDMLKEDDAFEVEYTHPDGFSFTLSNANFLNYTYEFKANRYIALNKITIAGKRERLVTSNGKTN